MSCCDSGIIPGGFSLPFTVKLRNGMYVVDSDSIKVGSERLIPGKRIEVYEKDDGKRKVLRYRVLD